MGDTGTISQLAELGVIFLMFGVGLHFSLKDLWKVRSVAIPGALGQMTFATLLGFGMSQIMGWTPESGIVLGLAISIASTVVLLRGLMDNGLLNTPAGPAAIGWLVLEDLATVLILVFMPTLSDASGGFDWRSLGITLLKPTGFVLLILFAGTRLIPWVLLRIAHTRSRELFILAILAIALGTALGAGDLRSVPGTGRVRRRSGHQRITAQSSGRCRHPSVSGRVRHAFPSSARISRSATFGKAAKPTPPNWPG